MGPQRARGLPRAIRVLEVRHRDRVRVVEPAQRPRAVARRLPVHRAEHRDLRGRAIDTERLGDRRVQIVGPRRARELGVARHRGEHARLDLTEVGAHEHVAGPGDHRGAHVGRQVVEPGRGSHPARRTVAAGPRAAQAAGVHIVVEPCVAERGRDPFALPPRQQRVDDGMRGAHALEPRRARVGHVDADRAEHRLHLAGAAQVERRTRGQVPQHLRVARLDARGAARRPPTEGEARPRRR